MTNKYYTIRYLVEAFKEAGMPISESWVRRQEEKGNLKIPRSTTNFKKSQGSRKMAAVRILTIDQIQKIVQSFLPGGSGYCDCSKN